MIVYGSRAFAVDVPSFLRAFRGRLDALPDAPPAADLGDCFVDFGEVASAAADALQPDEDDDPPGLTWWSRTCAALARALCAAFGGDATRCAESIAAARAAAAAIDDRRWTHGLAARTPEGFAQYGLFPEQYAAAAARLVRELAPARLDCVGIRSIGFPLAHVVAAAASLRGVECTVRSVRPRGHPFDRHVSLSARLRSEIARSPADVFAVVDEGPGLSGSSFGAAAEALAGCGISSARIVLLPSWDAPESSLRSSRARTAWQWHRRIVVRFEDAMPGGLARTLARGRTIDLSAGQWRRRVLRSGARWPAVQPQHERRKYLVRDGRSATLVRFAGLGRYGHAGFRRAEMLADAGLGAEPLGLEHGFLRLRWLDGAPLARRGRLSPARLDRVAGYLACLKRSFGTGSPDDLSDLQQMIAINLGTACAARFEPEERIAGDGRMLPHEWIACGDRLLKVDALDHHADDFFPGCRDIAWDVAGAIVEFGLDDRAAAALVDRYRRASGDGGIDRRLAFYRTAYAAWRLGYATLAAETLGDSADGRRFRADLTRYRRSAAARSAHRPRAPRC